MLYYVGIDLMKRGPNCVGLTKVSTFQERLKIALGDMTATDLAKKIGLSKQAVSTYITGVRSPKQPVIQSLASALNVNEAWLLGYDVPQERGNFDLYIASQDIPDYVKSICKTDDDVKSFLQIFFTKDEVAILYDYRALNKQGKEYIRQTMGMAKTTYKKDHSVPNVETG